ncbi:MAG: hypothetical protein ABW123_16355 [Cystobacter sp.]
MSKNILEAARELPADPRRRVFAEVPAETIELIDSAARLGWIPMSESMKLTDTLYRTLGGPTYRHFFSALSDRILNYPLLQSFFDGAVRLFGLTPPAMFKWSTYAWEQAFRESGRLVYRPVRETPHDGQVEMSLEDVHPLLMGDTFAESLAGTFEMFLRRVSRSGQVRMRPRERGVARLVYDVTWD